MGGRLAILPLTPAPPSQVPPHLLSVFPIGILADEQFQRRVLKKGATKSLCVSAEVPEGCHWWSWLLGDISQERFLWRRSSGSAHRPTYDTWERDIPARVSCRGLEVDPIPSLTVFFWAPAWSISWLETVSVPDKLRTLGTKGPLG